MEPLPGCVPRLAPGLPGVAKYCTIQFMLEHKPLLSIIAAMSENGVIGRDNKLPWLLPADLAHFKSLTLGKPIIMGRRTWESLPGLLPGRTHVVVTADSTYAAPGCLVVNSTEQALAAAGAATEVMIVGGEALYRQFLPRAARMYLTLVHTIVPGDTYFPRYVAGEWREVDRRLHQPDQKNPYAYSFVTLERVDPSAAAVPGR